MLDPSSSSFGFSGLAGVQAQATGINFNTDTGAITGGITRDPDVGDVVDGIGVVKQAGLTAFDFASLTIPAGATVTYTGSNALALLATGDLTIAGNVFTGPAPAPGPGVGGQGQKQALGSSVSGGGGGGFGGTGGTGGLGGGAGGPAYDATDFASDATFPTGSAGGAGALCGPGGGAGSPGGAGGGGVELVALGAVDLSGATIAAAGDTTASATFSSGGGGGSGGAVLVAAPAYTDTTGTGFAVDGGYGGQAGTCTIAGQSEEMGDGGSGGGGRVELLTGGTVSAALLSQSELAGPPPVYNHPGTGGGDVGTESMASFLSVSGATAAAVDVPTAAYTAAVPVGALSAVSWNWGDGTTASGSPTHTYTRAGTYTITATGTMAGSGATTRASFGPVVVIDTLDHIVVSPASATIAAGASQSFTANGFDAGNGPVGDRTADTAFTISPSGGATGASCTGNACTARQAGTYTITATDGGRTATATMRVTALPTTTSLTCTPASFPLRSSTGCEVIVTTTGGGAPPGGSVSLAPSGGCTLAGGECLATVTPSVVGTTTVTASYPGDSAHAASHGSTTVTPYDNAFELGAVTRNVRHGTVTMKVVVPEQGRLQWSGSGVRRGSKPIAAKGTASFNIAPSAAVARTLHKTGHAKATVSVTFTPVGGVANTKRKSITFLYVHRHAVHH